MARIDKMGAAALVTGILLGVGSAQARDVTLKAQEAKLEAQGKLQLCLKKNSAKMLAGKPDGSSGCQMKFQVALAKIGGGIPTTPRYLENGDGTVTDLNTGLQWEKKNNKLSGSTNYADPHDAYNVYSWCSPSVEVYCTSGNPPDGTVYTDFLAKLNNGASTDGAAMTPITGCFAGHCDWRLPSIVELQGIIDTTQGVCAGGSGACIDPAFGPTPASLYWSATSDSGTPADAWIGVFYEAGGPVGASAKGSLISVRAVRGGL